MSRFFDSGVATFEQAKGLLPYMRIGIQMPVWVVGIEPTSWEPIKNRYDEMYRVATEHGLACHPFESIFGSDFEPEAPTLDEGLGHDT
jgi:hypothetical protein